MISPWLLIGSGIVTTILCLAVAWQYRGQSVPVWWVMFVVMAGGGFSIALFYVGIYYSSDPLALVRVSRWIWILILGSTSAIAISALW